MKYIPLEVQKTTINNSIKILVKMKFSINPFTMKRKICVSSGSYAFVQ